jgi:hypothetical protein
VMQITMLCLICFLWQCVVFALVRPAQLRVCMLWLLLCCLFVFEGECSFDSTRDVHMIVAARHV